MKKLLLFIAIFLVANQLSHSQTALSQGDIAFVGFNLDGIDDYAFILLKDIDAATTINFTDCGWSDGAGSFICNVGDANAWTWTSGGAFSCGQIVSISVNSPGFTASVGFVSGTSPVLSGIGDQIFAYQGAAATPTFISGVNSNEAATDANWNGDTTNNQTSALPDVLTNGIDAIRLHNGGTESDNWQYNCAVVSGDTDAIRAAVNNITNWNNNNSTPYSPVAPSCAWSVSCVPLAINDNFKNKLKMFPNPTSGMVTIQLNQQYNNIDIKVRNILGQTISSFKSNSTDKITFDINKATGIYFVLVSNDLGENATFKVVKQ